MTNSLCVDEGGPLSISPMRFVNQNVSSQRTKHEGSEAMFNIDLVNGMFRDYNAAIIDRRISPKENMNNQWYFEIGRSAVEVIAAGVLSSHLQSVKTVLDIPCGYGRVLRHLVALFPAAQIHACDLDSDALDFCAQWSGVRCIQSREELTEVRFDSLYDIIWVGSLFTHTAEDVTKKWLAHLARLLTPSGIVVATLHGRWSVHVHKISPFIGDDRWTKIMAQYSVTGYGYEDYTRQENHPFISGRYGISLAKPHVTIRNLEEIPGIRIYLYTERGWSDNQDVVAFGCPPHDQPFPAA